MNKRTTITLFFKKRISILTFFLIIAVGGIQAQESNTEVKSETNDKGKETIQLKDPANIKTTVDYDSTSGEYIFHKRAGDFDVEVPTGMTPAEYSDYSMKKSLQSYWNKRNISGEEGQVSNNWFLNSLNNTPFGNLNIFGGLGAKVSVQGSAELRFGITRSRIDNPTIAERLRTTTAFDFEDKIQASVSGSVGKYVSIGLNYNTEATFNFDNQIKLRYQGDEDDILQTLEAGNVNLPLQSTLIQGSQSLWGIKTTLKFGKLTASAVVSQQKAESQTINLNGGAQQTEYSINVDQYDADRHFFLSKFFRERYESSLNLLPYINSGVKITRIEVWLTNREAKFDQSRNILAFSDLGEPRGDIYNTAQWQPTLGMQQADNTSNNLYKTITQSHSDVRDINKVTESLQSLPLIHNVADYEKIASARMLSPQEYIVNPSLGYISLNRNLSSDEVLSVAYEYVYRGKTYHVGELTNNSVQAPNTLITKLLRGSSMTPSMPYWDLMMKNVYAIGATQLATDNFQMNVVYRDDSTGANMMSLDVGDISGKTLLSVMNLDQMDYMNNRNPDGFFDYMEGYTVNSQYGRIMFPVLEPFGSHLKSEINNAAGDKYVYQELYDSTLVVAQQQTSKNKFKLTGFYKSGAGTDVALNAMNIAKGSVIVTAAGVPLTENVDYVVDYNLGHVRILNQSLVESGTPIKITLENQSLFNMQTKTMLGTHVEYKFNNKLSIGGTLMHLYEHPYTQKVNVGEEPVSNTIWGLNASYRSESQMLTNWLNAIPLLNVKDKSSVNVNAEVAELIPGHAKALGTDGTSYIDDFEGTKTGIDIRNYFAWSASAVPEGQPTMFPEASFINDTQWRNGKNRARMAWYYIDPMFNRVTRATPGYIANNLDALSDDRTREILSTEIWPDKDLTYGAPTAISTLNLAYYPSERGAYNYDVKPDPGISKGMGANGQLNDPESRWAGITRRIETSDFETNNIEYVEFWVLDPFSENPSAKGGDLYFNLGNISEDVLKDGYKFYENGMPGDGSLTGCDTTAWGVVPTKQGLVNAFDNDGNSRLNQDVGLNGLNSTREKQFFHKYLDDLRTYVPYVTSPQAMADPQSPMNDPSGDNYHYYRGSDYDRDQVSILDRYKYYNNTEGNSLEAGQSGESYSTAATTIPSSEDINGDNTLSEQESYYQYKIELKPNKMEVGQNYIVDKRESNVNLANGKSEVAKWYQFRIPIHNTEGRQAVGGISDFKSIRFMRMFLKGFKDETFLRFATLDLVRSDWRPYTKQLYAVNRTPISTGTLDIAAVNVEENASRKPVNYIMPPGVSRMTDPSQLGNKVRLNEQALSLKIANLAPQDARGVYKNSQTDLRRYKRLQMYWHAEAPTNGTLDDNQLTAFIRIGTDNEDNYYEYEIPLKVTPEGQYNPDLDREKVWPEANYMDFPFSKFTDLKLKRNSAKNKGGMNIAYTKEYTEIDVDHPSNRITVVGNPSIGAVKTMMLGVRNRSGQILSGEVWANELRVADFDEQGGWAGNVNAAVRLSDLGSVSLSGMFQTAGFGALDQTMQQRSQDNYSQYSIASNLEMGKLLPEKAKVQMPVYFAYSKAVSTPKYDPFSNDIKLSETLNTFNTQQQKDSVKNLVETRETRKSLNVSNARVNIASKNPMPYDPANFSMDYSYTEANSSNPTIESAKEKTYHGGISYSYAPNVKPLEPFKNSQSVVLQNPAFQLIKDINFSYLPQSISYRMQMHRYYYENQLRDVNNFRMDPQVRRQFYFDRMFAMQYNPFKSLQMNLTTTTNAIIDEPFTINGKNYIINKDLYPQEYQVWKDSVWTSIRHFGRTAQYSQAFNASYTVPFDKIPYLNWINANGTYASSYSWMTGPQLGADAAALNIVPGNTITNVSALGLKGDFNMINLYNKSSYLKDINSQYRAKAVMRGSSSATGSTREVRYEDQMNLVANKEITINHKLGTKIIRARGYDEANRAFAIKIVPIDENTSKISYSRNVENARVVLMGEVDAKKSPLEEAAKVALRVLMGVRDISVSYDENNQTSLYGFTPTTGFMGQDPASGAPGYAFAFGAQDPNFGRNAMKNGWVTDTVSQTSPYAMTTFSHFSIRARIEPMPDFRIDLNVDRLYANSYSEYLQPSAPYYDLPYQTGNITMTYNAIGSSFWKVGTSGDYYSESFDKFLDNRNVVAQRIAAEKEAAGVHYPTTGDYAGQAYAGTPYHANQLADGTFDPTATSGVNLNSPDVMIPAFLAAYSGKSAESASLGLIPTLTSMLPNWRLSYTGLSNFAWFKKKFSSITLVHAYQCTYSVGSYSTNPSYQTYNDGFGFTPNVSGGYNPGFISQYDVPSVNITEAFNPLISIDVKMRNNFMFRSAINRARNVGLNIPSNQLMEGFNNSMTFGVGYRVDNFGMIVGWGQNSKKVRNDLTLKLDLSLNDMKTFIRRIDEQYSQPSAGVKTTSLTVTADYILTQNINVRLYYDQIVKTQLISSFYNTANTNFGVSFRFTLTE